MAKIAEIAALFANTNNLKNMDVSTYNTITVFIGFHRVKITGDGKTFFHKSYDTYKTYEESLSADMNAIHEILDVFFIDVLSRCSTLETLIIEFESDPVYGYQCDQNRIDYLGTLVPKINIGQTCPLLKYIDLQGTPLMLETDREFCNIIKDTNTIITACGHQIVYVNGEFLETELSESD